VNSYKLKAHKVRDKLIASANEIKSFSKVASAIFSQIRENNL